jgi:prophage tail gpP-like protein
VPEKIEVLVRGKTLSDWQSVRITRAIDAASGSFQITSPARSPYPLAPGDPLEIYATGDLVLKGHVEMVERSFGPRSSAVLFSGRDDTADLVDCSARNAPGDWTNVHLITLIRELCAPFGVAVDDRSRIVGPFETFHLRPGDTAWAAIERACRLRGILVFSDGSGRLVMRQAGLDFADVELVEGENLKGATFTVDDGERFRTYVVVGQRPGSDEASGDFAALVEGEATDQGARSPRALVIVAEAGVNNQTAQERAQWEAVIRAARAVRVQAQLNGWRQVVDAGAGRLWTLNELVTVRSPSLDLDRSLLVRALTFTQTERSETVELDLVRADAYQPQPDLKAEDDLLDEWLKATTAGESLPDDPDLESEEGL